ncbi:hypothetical protein FPZ43_05470 [Mucilaginibacter pallidiroseus]|uniref:CarboxypepD_reg-like domain-containing protein n=1 Tax=Mucilaginibacter pallidiroseus TaxID=2599295 RepID=A0A563UG73_9SPHI|nr:hypothetical protein [Mucilaginibacter pallidiroseus]TWR30390.1 hypothetical protein FPZ43_05470 [Mucilaginibacter pallidiroseus]
MKHIILIISIICFSIARLSAQQAATAKGSIFKKISNDRLGGVLISNKNKKTATIADNLGNFTIKADKGDSLQFELNRFTPQIQVVNGYDMIVYMQPQVSLNEVVVRGQTKKQGLNEVQEIYRKKGLYYDGKPPVFSFFTNPISSFYELFSKDAKNLRRFQAFAKNEAEQTAVDSKYNKSLVKRITGANDSVATKFMEYYRPHYDEVKTWSDYDLIKRVKRAWDGYLKNKARVVEKPLSLEGQ